MSSARLLYIASIGLLLAGCGGQDQPPAGEQAYEQYFAEKLPAPKDRSVRLAADPMRERFAPGSAVELNVMISNMGKRRRAFPIGVETQAGCVHTFFFALVRDEAGRIERVPFTTDEAPGPVVWLELDQYGGHTEVIPLGEHYVFEEPGPYRVVLFYSIEEGQVPGDRTPEWTGTVWTSPIHITIE